MRLVYQRDDRGLLQPHLVRSRSSWPRTGDAVRTIIGRTPPVLTASDSLREAAERLEEEGSGALPVRDGAELGIISERDITNAVAFGCDPAATRVAAVMTREVVAVDSDTTLTQVARTMAEKDIRHVVVVHRETPIAVVSVLEVLRALVPPEAPPAA